MRRLVVMAAVVAAGSFGWGCNTAGPRGLRSGGVAYNLALARTSNEQLLLNLVRLRYRDVPVMLAVSSISSQYQFSASAGISGEPSDGDSVSTSLGFGFSEKPTVTFTPLRGEEFVKQMLTPIAPATVALLFHSGWNFDRVARCLIQGMNGVDNAHNASSPTPSKPPVFADFKRVATLVRMLQKRNLVEFGTGDDDGELVLKLAPEAAASAEMREVAEILGVTPGRTEYTLTPTVLRAPADRIGVNMRSLSGVLYFLAQGVEVPRADEESGLVTVTRIADGGRFDWGEVSGDLLRIRSSAGEPKRAAVKVRYRGSWFYLADDDLNSKSTFSMLVQLTALQAGGVPSAAPVLTLPLG